MSVVGENQHLSMRGQHPERLEGGSCALIVKLDQDVVDNDRQRRTGLEMPLDGRQAQCQVELIAGTLAHCVNRNALVIIPHTDEHLTLVFAKVHLQAPEAA